jgi:UTP--glucose-1-phosphate uridylyltransferase
MIKKVVIPAAGLGTRLLPITKELPKEMLPIFFKQNNVICLKPMLQAIFEQLYDFGFREFSFIVGRGKRAIEDHFTIDEGFLDYLKNNNKVKLADELLDFYKKLNNSAIVFINQPKTKGFGDAVYRARLFTGNEPFLIHAGDDLIFSRNNDHLRRMMKAFRNYDADVVFLIEEVEDPRGYGVILGEKIEPDIFRVKKVVEKPQIPPSNLAIIALYVFKPIIYRMIEKIKPDENDEVQLTDAISLLLNQRKVYAVKLKDEERRIDIGTPETYLKTLRRLVEC